MKKQYQVQCEMLKKKIDELKEKIRRYYIAYDNYLNKEKLFEANGLVPGVKVEYRVQNEIVDFLEELDKHEFDSCKDKSLNFEEDVLEFKEENLYDFEFKNDDSECLFVDNFEKELEFNNDDIENDFEEMNNSDIEKLEQMNELNNFEEQSEEEKIIKSIKANQETLKELKEILLQKEMEEQNEPSQN